MKETIKVALDSEVNFEHLKKYVSYVNENSFEFDYLTIRAAKNRGGTIIKTLIILFTILVFWEK